MSVRHALLGLLAQGDGYGYELHAAFEQLVGGRATWDLKPAQVYTTLTRLEEAGLIAQTVTRRVGGPDQRVFAITPAGREELSQWYRAGCHSTHQRDEVYLKLVIAIADRQADPRAIIAEQRATLYRDLHELSTRRGGTGESITLPQRMLLDKAIMHIEADLRWIEMVEARLHEMQPHLMPRRPGGEAAGADDEGTGR